MPDSLDITVRTMQLDDLEQVLVIDKLSFSQPWPASSFKFELNENASSLCHVADLVVAEGKRQLVGMSVVWMIVDEAHIATIAVHPDYRRRGVARKLLKEALRASIERGALSATLEVRATNEAAQSLYRDFGFDVIGRRPGYYKNNAEDALLMSVYDLDQDYLDWMEDEQDTQPE